MTNNVNPLNLNSYLLTELSTCVCRRGVQCCPSSRPPAGTVAFDSQPWWWPPPPTIGLRPAKLTNQHFLVLFNFGIPPRNKMTAGSCFGASDQRSGSCHPLRNWGMCCSRQARSARCRWCRSDTWRCSSGPCLCWSCLKIVLDFMT